MAKWKRGYDGKLHPLYDHHFRPRTQEPELMEDMFQENGSFYAIKIDAFRKYQDFLGEDVEFFETPVYVDIDSPVDFARAEQEILKVRENEQKARQEA
ncbi:MAG: hypothetical protein GX568_04265 [Candidatus Gastranaerophilales bacterium]|nr:hypothetical protein [Candidatus Gastranaerophilales bacterium]